MDEQKPRTYFRFEHVQHEIESQQFGPYEFIQLTYNELRTSPDGQPFAYYDSQRQEWHIYADKAPTPYSDVVVWSN